MGPVFEQVQKMILLQTIDQRWKEHLALIDHLKEGIGLRGYAQKDPLVEYKKEAFGAFENLNSLIQSETIEKIMKIQLVMEEQQPGEFENLMLPDQDQSELVYGTPSEQSLEMGGSPASRGTPNSGEKKKMSWQVGAPSDGNKMNRAERRRLEKKK